MNKILLVGVARSGTTWVGTILSKCKDTFFFNEPDDERRFRSAAEAKTYLTRYPNIAPGDIDKVGEASIRNYAALWERAWGQGIGGYQNALVKSVFAPFCLEWIKETFRIDHVVWVHRELRDVIASWYEYSSEKHPEIGKEVLIRRLAWQASQHQAAYDRLNGTGFYSLRVDHRTMVQNAEKGFKYLAGVLGLEWTHEAMEQLADLNSAGVGGHYGLEGYDLSEHIRRNAEDVLDEDAWKKKVPEELMAIAMREVAKWA
jgi:hypothetical protein